MATENEPSPREGRLSDDEAAQLAEQIGRLTSAGLALAPGLRATAEEMPQRRLASVLRAVASALDEGASIEEALARQGPRLPEHLRGIVQAGVKVGKTGEVLGRFVGFSNVGDELRWRLRINLVHPIVAILLCMGLFVFVCVTLIDSFEMIYKDFGVPLPVMTLALLEIAHLFNRTGIVFVDVVVAFVFLFALFFFVIPRATRRGFLGDIPILGSVWRNAALAEFCQLLALMLETSIPLGESLRLTGKGVRDGSIDRASEAMGDDVDGGAKLSEAMARQRVFPRGVGRVLRWAEANQGLPPALHMIGEMFEARARSQATFVGAFLNVLVLCVLIFGIAFVVIGLFLPLITLLSSLSG